MEVKSYNQYGGFWRRFAAFFIDRFVIWFVLLLLLFRSVDLDMYDISNLFSGYTLFIELIIMIYFVYFESISSYKATIGKKLLGMQVVNEQYEKITPQISAIRYFTKYLSMLVLGFGFIAIAFNDKKQGWHDKVAGTYVIKK